MTLHKQVENKSLEKNSTWCKLHSQKSQVAINITQTSKAEIVGGKEAYFIIIKWSNHQKDIIKNNRTSKYIKLEVTELKGEIENSIITIGDSLFHPQELI